MKRIYILLLALAAACGCKNHLPEEVLLPMTDISLSVKGEEIMKFEENSCQLGYNNKNHMFRVLNDRLTDWFILDCEATPTSVGQKVIAGLEYTTENDVKTVKDLVFSVEQTDEDGLVWLWEKTRSIGVVIKVL